MSYFVDSHAHLYLSQFDEDRDEMLQRCNAQGVKKVLLPNIDTSSIASMLALADGHPEMCYPMMGLHPCSVGTDSEVQMSLVRKWLDKGDFVAVGEIGTDTYWSSEFIEEQKRCFIRQVEWAKERRLPVVIHSRDTLDLNIELVRQLQDGELRGVFHCFTGTVEQAEQVADVGFLMGFGGIATFKNGGLSPVIKHVGLEAILLETDAPYLSPEPYRGKRNESSYLPFIAQRVAEIKGITREEVMTRTTGNAIDLFPEIE